MNKFKKRIFLILLCIVLIAGGVAIYLIKESPNRIKNEEILLEAKSLLTQGYDTNNNELIKQAKDKYTLWIEANKETNNKKVMAEVLLIRSNISMVLGQLYEMLNDMAESVKYNPLGEIQYGICLVKKELKVESSELQSCYDKAVQMFADKNTDKKDGNYLIARIMAGDKSAIAEYKAIVDETQDPMQLETYKLIAREHFDKSVCEQILPDCEQE